MGAALRGRGQPRPSAATAWSRRSLIPARGRARSSRSSSPASRSSSPTGSSAACAPGRSTAASASGSSCPGGMLALVARHERRAEDDGHHHPRPGRQRQHLRDDFHVPDWVVVCVGDRDRARHLRRAAGGSSAPWARRIIKMDPAQGFAAQGAGAAVILAASHFGYPALDDARDLRRRHGRRARPSASPPCAGGGRQHRGRLGAHAPASAADRRGAYGVTRSSAPGALGPVVVALSLLSPSIRGVLPPRRGGPDADRGGLRQWPRSSHDVLGEGSAPLSSADGSGSPPILRARDLRQARASTTAARGQRALAPRPLRPLPRASRLRRRGRPRPRWLCEQSRAAAVSNPRRAGVSPYQPRAAAPAPPPRS